jgi:antitoxin VapB
MVRRLARLKGLGLTETVKLAVGLELRRETEAAPLRDRIAPLRDEILAREPTGLEADKAFFDDLSGCPLGHGVRARGRSFRLRRGPVCGLGAD